MRNTIKPQFIETNTTGSASRPDGGNPANPARLPEIEIDGWIFTAKRHREYVDINAFKKDYMEHGTTVWREKTIGSIDALNLAIELTSTWTIALILDGISSAEKAKREKAKVDIRALKKRGQQIHDFAMAVLESNV